MSYHPLTPLGYSVIDYAVFKAHLRLPRPWLRAILRTYRDLKEVPFVMGTLNTKLNDYYWSSMQNPTLFEKQLLIAGIPSPYIPRDDVPVAKRDPFRAYETILRHLPKFVGQGKILYLHSTFQENAMIAATNIAKQGVKLKIPTYMVDVPSYIATTKDFETNSKSDVLAKASEAEVLILWSLGTEYYTPWVEAALDSLVRPRLACKRTTIFVSHLTPADHKKRYGQEPLGTTLEFTDSGIKQTLSDLIAELEAES